MKNIYIIGIIVIAVVSLFLFLRSPAEEPLSSVAVSGEYLATTTSQMGTPLGAVTKRQLRTGPSTLGSIVIASTTAHSFRVYNATSTTDVSSSTLVNFVADVAAGTYTFDVQVNRGIIIEMPSGFNGEYVVTWR